MVRPPDGTTSGVGGRHGSPWRAAGAALVALSAVTGLFMLRAAVEADSVPPPPQPVAEAAPTAGPGALPPEAAPGPAGPTSPEAGLPAPPKALPPLGPASGPPGEPVTGLPAGPSADTWARPQAAVGLPRSVPTRIAIPKIKVDAHVRELGVNPDGTLAVPPLERAQDAGWYRLGPSPGEIGNAVVVGHVDSRHTGPAVFYRLGALRPGDTITLSRADGTVVRFRVDGVRSFPKEQFPTELVYGPNDQAGLRVVTCGGKFDEGRQTYLDNIVVFATLVPPTPATAPPTPAPTPT